MSTRQTSRRLAKESLKFVDGNFTKRRPIPLLRMHEIRPERVVEYVVS